MNFSDIRNHLYDRAEKYWLVSLFLGLSLQFGAAVSSVIRNTILTIVISTLLFLVPIVTQWLREKSRDDTMKALKCRLAILYSDALGEDIPLDIAREIKSWAAPSKVNTAPFEKPYYDSKLPVGPNRLADIISESAFWTFRLADHMKTLMFVYTGVYLISSLTIMYFLFQIDLGAGILISAAKGVMSLIAIVFTSEAGLLIKQYNELSTEAKRIYGITEKMTLMKKLKIIEVMQLVEEYNILLIVSPPIPSKLYKAKQEILNKAYKEEMEKE